MVLCQSSIANLLIRTVRRHSSLTSLYISTLRRQSLRLIRWSATSRMFNQTLSTNELHSTMPSALQITVPPSNSTVEVSIIDTTAWAYKVDCGDLFRPPFPGLETFDLCSYAFLIKHEKRLVLFDLGIRKDWENLIPNTVARLKDSGTDVQVEKDLLSILRDGGTDPDQIEAVVWSHIHWDHTGNLASFPPAVELIVGPGIKQQYMPGWPAVPDAHFRETDVLGRKIIALESNSFNIDDIGGLRGFDYFGDGSFYLLDAPGHLLGHLNALARTSNDPESFIFMAADSVHLGGEIRPSEAIPLPDNVDIPGINPRPCPYEQLLEIHPRHSRTLPYLGLAPCFLEDLEAAEKTIKSVQRFDADDRVLVVFTHDVSLYDILEFYPVNANRWRDKGWKSVSRWLFLSHLQKIAKVHEHSKLKHVEF